MAENRNAIEYPSPAHVVKCFFKPEMYRPDMSVNTLEDIDTALLEQREGIHSYILDADHTLLGFNDCSIDERVAERFNEMRKSYGLCILTNSPGYRRNKLADHFREIDVKVIESEYLKPRLRAFNDALSYLGERPSNTSLVSDMLIDIFGANLAGIYSVKVEPMGIEHSPLPVRAVLGVDRALAAAARMFYSDTPERDIQKSGP
ncbi:MAG: hypothetical protein R6U32_01600 [Candidatus Woesearchaeota archaeon]